MARAARSAEPAAPAAGQPGLLAAAVRRHVPLLVVCALLAGGAGAAYAHRLHPKYTSALTLLPRPITGNPLSPDTSASSGTQLTVAMQTEAGLVDTPAVAALASRALGTTVPAPGDVVSATVPPNTQIIRIAYTSRTAIAAQRRAQAFGTAFLQYRHSVAVTAQQQTLASLQRQAQAAAAALQTATADAAKNKDPQSFAAQEVLLFGDRLATLDDSISTTEALSTDPGVLVTAAPLPTAAVGLPSNAYIVIGLLLGLGIGLLVAMRLEWRKDVVDPSAEYEVAGVPVLATVPAPGSNDAGRLPAAGSGGPVSNAYRRMRAGLVALAPPPCAVAVCCVEPSATAGELTAMLGVSLGRAGYRVTVVVADPEEHTVETLLGAASAPGLSDVLTDGAAVGDCLQTLHGISVLLGGADSQHARELYAGPRLASLLRDLRATNDYVLVAARSTASPDADAVALACGATVLVVTEGTTTHAQAAATLARLQRLGVQTIGAVSLPVARRARSRRRRGAAGSARSSAPVGAPSMTASTQRIPHPATDTPAET